MKILKNREVNMYNIFVKYLWIRFLDRFLSKKRESNKSYKKMEIYLSNYKKFKFIEQNNSTFVILYSLYFYLIHLNCL